jgi:hypothetical protein
LSAPLVAIAQAGGSVLAIAHNGNVSNGQMFPIEPSTGS